MLDCLETELVEAIFLAVLARERRSTLRAACLTSKRLRLVAQPLLWHNVVVRRKPMLSCLAQRPATRTPFLGGFLVEVRLRGVVVRQEDNLEVALVRVQHFSLAHGGIGGPDQQPPTLPNLVTLTLLEMQAHPSFAEAWLRPARLPARRVLHVTLFRDGLSLPRSDAHRCGCGHCYAWKPPRDALSGLDQLIHRLPSFHLRTLTLPRDRFGFLGEHASLEPGLKPAWRRLLAACEKEGVEVLWEEEEEERGATKVSDVYRRWARGRRAADGR